MLGNPFFAAQKTLYYSGSQWFAEVSGCLGKQGFTCEITCSLPVPGLSSTTSLSAAASSTPGYKTVYCIQVFTHPSSAWDRPLLSSLLGFLLFIFQNAAQVFIPSFPEHSLTLQNDLDILISSSLHSV